MVSSGCSADPGLWCIPVQLALLQLAGATSLKSAPALFLGRSMLSFRFRLSRRPASGDLGAMFFMKGQLASQCWSRGVLLWRGYAGLIHFQAYDITRGITWLRYVLNAEVPIPKYACFSTGVYVAGQCSAFARLATTANNVCRFPRRCGM